MPSTHLPPWVCAAPAIERPQTAPAKALSTGGSDRGSLSRHTGPPPEPGAAAAFSRFGQTSSLVPLLAKRGADASQPPAVRLLRSSWLERRAAALMRCRTDEERAALALPSRLQLEDMDPSCFMSVEEVLHGEGRRRTRFNFDIQAHDASILVVSHCHLGAAHPDPLGQQLVRLVEAMNHERARTDRLDFPSPTMGDHAVFYSWCSVYQAPDTDAAAPSPTPSALAAARSDARLAAMSEIELWFVHKACRLVVLDVPHAASSAQGSECVPRLGRAWPHFELGVHALVRHCVHGLRVPPPLFVAPCTPHVPPPRTPGGFAKLLAGCAVGVEGERELLCSRYSATLEHVFRCAEQLQFAGCGWGDEECVALAQVLPLCKGAKLLNVSRNPKISDAGIGALCAALLPPGSAPRLKEVNLQHIPYGAKGAEALRAVSRERDVIWRV